MPIIVYDHQIFWRQKYGGVSRYIYEVATKVSETDDCQVKILGLAYANEYLKECQKDLIIGLPVPKFPGLQIPKIIGKTNDLVAKNWLKNNTPDIVHETYYHSDRLAPKKSKIVVTVHDMIHEKFTQFLRREMFGLDKTSQIKKQAVTRADKIICVSENTKKDLIEILDINPEKVNVVYHGPSLKISTNSQINLEKFKPYILYVGERISAHKNFRLFLQAYANSTQLKNNFNLVFFGGSSLSKAELKLIQELELSTEKIFQVSGNDKTLANFYHSASIFVYPSLYEGFGIPLLEAMSLDCPIACSNTSSLPEVVGNAAEFFDPEQPESMTNAMENVLFSSGKSTELVKLAREQIKKFSWEKAAEETKKVYLSLL
ncbi:glycosyltransferase family 4 protein [Dapis sp. BLCC M229]|uniref:glycosyltransferase family 4 protein n=1 Tax=Dapis sp. BLCC M229 TaxID=3400188 RepID=UPI003CF3D1F8